MSLNIPINDFEQYIKTVCAVNYILKGEVIKVDKDKHRVDVKIFLNNSVTDLILSNVYVPFIWGLNDEAGANCLVGLEEGDITKAYILNFYSNTKKLIINLGNIKINGQDDEFFIEINGIKLDIKDKIKITGDVEVTGNIKVSGNVEDVNGTMAEMRNTFNLHTHSFTGVKEGTTGTTAAPSSPMA